MVLMNLFARHQWRKRHKEQTCGHWEKGEEGEVYGKSAMETSITMSEMDSQWEFAVRLQELKEEPCINLEGWGGEGHGREIQEKGDMFLNLKMEIKKIKSYHNCCCCFINKSCPTLATP